MPTLTYLDETRMKAVFAAAEPTAETILRLARQAGLRRQEIWALTWGQVDQMEWKIHLPDRTVPMDLELAMYLLPLSEGKTPDDSVAASRRSGEALTPQTISHLARAALTAAGLLKGILEIAGTDSVYPDFLQAGGGLMLAVAAVLYLILLRGRHEKG